MDVVRALTSGVGLGSKVVEGSSTELGITIREEDGDRGRLEGCEMKGDGIEEKKVDDGPIVGEVRSLGVLGVGTDEVTSGAEGEGDIDGEKTEVGDTNGENGEGEEVEIVVVKEIGVVAKIADDEEAMIVGDIARVLEKLIVADEISLPFGQHALLSPQYSTLGCLHSGYMQNTCVTAPLGLISEPPQKTTPLPLTRFAVEHKPLLNGIKLP